MNFININNLPDPCVAFLVSVSPCLALIVSGLLIWHLNTLVGPIKRRQTEIASTLAKMYTSDGPLLVHYYNIIFLILKYIYFVTLS